MPSRDSSQPKNVPRKKLRRTIDDEEVAYTKTQNLKKVHSHKQKDDSLSHKAKPPIDTNSSSVTPLLGKRKRSLTQKKQAYDEMNLSRHRKKKLENQIKTFCSNAPLKRAKKETNSNLSEESPKPILKKPTIRLKKSADIAT